MSFRQERAIALSEATRLPAGRAKRGFSWACGATLLSTVSLLALGRAAQAADTAAAADPNNAINNVIVTAPRQEDKARAVQKAAPNLISVQSAEGGFYFEVRLLRFFSKLPSGGIRYGKALRPPHRG